ncbi:NRDE family protein [Azohydromonas caseinilytica]|uniref:NRDE family protein n=1 Tax=Azohydromonas caseinilytica TaxID=2728836 RepID=A0A848FD65_9BURK|nr:NRDE family protein [Azohydromonas caseinilytica]NML17404.1 NRDE family protein [Azohydromonas caseinilytica]
MCLIALAWDADPRFDLVVAANRDEFLDRPTAPLHRWPDGTLAGRDLRAGGTWMGLTVTGRLAMLTNVRRPGAVRPDAPSRGEIVTQWLHGAAEPAGFCAELAAAGHNPFNLIAGDIAGGELFWTGSDHPTPHPLAPGLHAVSNAVLDTPWPKLRRLKAGLAQALRESDSAEALVETLLHALSHRERVPDAELPSTGVPLELERGLSSVFIDMPHYGTRSSTVLVRERESRRLVVVELSHGPQPQRRRVELPQWPATMPTTPSAEAVSVAS